MNKTERLYLADLYENMNRVPNTRNAMNTLSKDKQRYDLMEQALLSQRVVYALIYFGSEPDNKEYWTNEINAAMKDLKDFYSHRESENWETGGTYRYKCSLVGW